MAFDPRGAGGAGESGFAQSGDESANDGDVSAGGGSAVWFAGSAMDVGSRGIFLRTETELIIKSRRVTPRKLLASGFRSIFLYLARQSRT